MKYIKFDNKYINTDKAVMAWTRPNGAYHYVYLSFGDNESNFACESYHTTREAEARLHEVLGQLGFQPPKMKVK
jgi:hypothetical protein